jgi:hypothetical protein
MISCYEAGYDGFWLHRLLEGQGVHSLVVDPASVQVDRRARRAKTDRIDGERFLRSLMAYLRGEPKVMSANLRITIRNVLINDMEHCAKLGDVSTLEPVLTLLDMGGWAALRVVCPGAIAKVTIETNHGSATYAGKVAAGMVGGMTEMSGKAAHAAAIDALLPPEMGLASEGRRRLGRRLHRLCRHFHDRCADRL